MPKLYYILFLLIASFHLQAQPDLNKERLAEFKILTEQRVNDLQEYITQIGNKSLPIEQRQIAIDLAVDLFEKDYEVNGKRRSPYIQVSRRNGMVEAIPVRAYFNNLLGVKFDKVEITYYDAAAVSDFEKGTDGNYHATATYFQQFKGFDNSGKMIYGSRDRKDIRVTGKSMAVYKNLGKEDLKIFFGDVTVRETIPIKGY
ncbi:hypothetical protein [Telluribacter humicola]|uniref:hypothetical protein n=1 Tax=Telluribacter humicola TaxID=1720261 RepID=UPI001A9619EA|nr:hypothetical protein [Telluribacter humicola]